MGPSGGEPDRTGPVIIGTSPENGTTNFDGDEISFEFNEFIDRNSFRNNVSIEPDLAIELDYSFRRKTATVKFQDDLPENTTVVVKVGVDVADARRNDMGESFDLAVSTGDVLDSGEVTAKVLDARTGSGESGKRVFLYREPVDFSERAMYVAQSDTAGSISFGYLSEGIYRAIWVDDLNRNRIWDPEREPAQPFTEEEFRVVQDQTIDLGSLYYLVPDTTAPAIDGVGLLSENRLRIRMSENVTWDEESYFSVTDTLGNEFTRAYPLYLSESDPGVMFAQSVNALTEDSVFTVQPNGFTDNAGNSLTVRTDPFIGSSEPDTTALRTVSHNSGSGLFPDESLEITYTRFIDDESVIDSLLVFEGDQMFDNWPATEIDRHILRISPAEDVWESGLRYEFRVWNPWDLAREQINPEFWQRNQLGGIEVSLENVRSDESRRYIQINDAENSIRVDSVFTGNGPILIDNLPPLTYNITVYEDLNDNGSWNSGSITPFEAPEPYTVRRNVPVREGFTSEVTVEFSVFGARSDSTQTEPEISSESVIEESEN
ncbi:hypothetical protein DDZ15_04485 [Rhodohalobacter mucosus]|uniref:SbsA Ig-like domain-containing protein n=2 Tax=Rhodohalobacter mucosus TaxID=2079485 RepID=A0A316TXT5_9BACT|nr:hypothetical protein DDZ15_04485 [Rhodohalobacter mucosus]